MRVAVGFNYWLCGGPRQPRVTRRPGQVSNPEKLNPPLGKRHTGCQDVRPTSQSGIGHRWCSRYKRPLVGFNSRSRRATKEQAPNSEQNLCQSTISTLGRFSLTGLFLYLGFIFPYFFNIFIFIDGCEAWRTFCVPFFPSSFL